MKTECEDVQVLNLHATCVAFGTNGIVITGRSGSGKSSLALQLIAIGAVLVSDDRTRLTISDGVLVANAPRQLAGVIEARQIGLLQVPYQPRAAVQLIVNLNKNEQKRLPDLQKTGMLGISVDTVNKIEGPAFPAALKALAMNGRYNG